MPIAIRPVVRPTTLTGATNGKLPLAALVSVFFPGYGHRSVEKTAARCWGVFALKCLQATGKTLTVTPGGAYRTYDQQVAAFNTRMTTNPLLARVPFITRTWNGTKYYLKRGYAPVAVPGTSNHGWGIAFDTAIWNGATAVGITSDPKVWSWVQANADLYGFSWEGALPGQPGFEPWHLRMYTGDKVPEAVLEVERYFAAVAKA